MKKHWWLFFLDMMTVFRNKIGDCDERKTKDVGAFYNQSMACSLIKYSAGDNYGIVSTMAG